MLEPPTLGRQPERQVGLTADLFADIDIRVVEADGEVLDSTERIIEATYAQRPLVARLQYEDAGYRVCIDHPVKTMNVNPRDGVFQTDTGPSSRPTGGRSRQALPQPDSPQPRQRQGVPAVAAIERDDPPTIREHVPRRLPVGRSNRMASARQTRDGTIHTSRTTMFAIAADGRDTTDDRRVAAGPSALVTAPHNEPTEAAALKALGVLSRPLRYLGVRCSHIAQRSVRRY